MSNALADEPRMVHCFSQFTRAPSQTLTIHKKTLTQKEGTGDDTNFTFLKYQLNCISPAVSDFWTICVRLQNETRLFTFVFVLQSPLILLSMIFARLLFFVGGSSRRLCCSIDMGSLAGGCSSIVIGGCHLLSEFSIAWLRTKPSQAAFVEVPLSEKSDKLSKSS